MLSAAAALALAIPALAATSPNGAAPQSATMALPSAVPSIPPAMTARYDGITSHLRPSVLAWTKQEAQIFAARPTFSLQDVETAIQARFAGQGVAQMNLSGGDIEEIAFVVMMQALQDQDSDLQAQMNQMKALTAAKSQIRNEIALANQRVASAVGSSPSPPASSNASTTNLTNRLDSLNAQSETQSLQVQTMTQRRSKLIDTLWDLLKSIQGTSDAVVQNLK